MSYKSRGENVADYDLIYQTETGKALCIRRDTNSEDIWLPLSQVQFDDNKVYIRGSVITVTMPDWLAEKHDLA